MWDLNDKRRNILYFLLCQVAAVADLSYQKRIWIAEEGPQQDSFVEVVCIFFDYYDLIQEEPEEFRMTQLQEKLLKLFHARFKKFSKENDYPEIFIDTPEWAEIRKLAQEVLVAFHYKKKSLFQMKLDRIKYRIVSFFTEWLKKIKQILLALFFRK